MSRALTHFDDFEVYHCFKESLDDSTKFWGKRFVRLGIPPQECRMRGNRYLMQIAFSNLLDNAAKYSQPDHHIKFQMDRNDDWIDLIIINKASTQLSYDTGPLFLKFCHGLKSMNADSVGLGLYLTRSIIEQHGGRVGLTSVDNGNVVANVRLPFHSRLETHGNNFSIRKDFGDDSKP